MQRVGSARPVSSCNGFSFGQALSQLNGRWVTWRKGLIQCGPFPTPAFSRALSDRFQVAVQSGDEVISVVAVKEALPVVMHKPALHVGATHTVQAVIFLQASARKTKFINAHQG